MPAPERPEPLERPEEREARFEGRASLPRLLLAGAIGALVTALALLAFGVFVAFEQHLWSPGHIGMRAAQLLGAGLAWALVIDLPVSLLRERAGWHRYLCLVVEAVLVVPVVALGLALAGAFTAEALAAISAVAVMPVLLFAGVSMVAARRR